MGELSATSDGEKCSIVYHDGLAVIENIAAGITVEFTHKIETVKRKEMVAGMEFTVVWRGCDVVDLLPRGEHLRLYQRRLDIEKYIPTPNDIKYVGPNDMGPTQQKK